MKIIAATTADIETLVALVNSAYRGEVSKKGWTTEADLLDGKRTDATAMQQLLQTENAVILTCRNEDDMVLGCVYLLKKNQSLYLGMLTVAPHLQAQGIGKFLLSAAEEFAVARNCFCITMTVISVRVELIAWYNRHGFVATGATQPFPNDPAFGLPRQPLEFIVMEKLL